VDLFSIPIIGMKCLNHGKKTLGSFTGKNVLRRTWVTIPKLYAGKYGLLRSA